MLGVCSVFVDQLSNYCPFVPYMVIRAEDQVFVNMRGLSVDCHLCAASIIHTHMCMNHHLEHKHYKYDSKSKRTLQEVSVYLFLIQI